MRILHISDSHGIPREPQESFDVVVHSGDLLPNGSYGVRDVETAFQPRWLEQNAARFPNAFRGKPFIYVPGNHDFVDPAPYLKAHGILARTLVDEVVEVNGLRFWGHPWTPPFFDWNYMLRPEAMKLKLDRLVQALKNEKVDVVVSHGPMFGVLDRNADGDRCGCKQLRAVLATTTAPPRALLHGHIHESPGLTRWRSQRSRVDQQTVLVSNAATTQRVIEL